MTRTVLPMKGLGTPRLLLWCRGFLHGKLLRTGGADPRGVITSGYISGQLERFRGACAVRREQAEWALSGDWRRAGELLAQLEALRCPVPGASAPRAADRRAEEGARALTELSAIAQRIRCELSLAQDQMEATAALLRSGFAAYGHGLLLGSLGREALPDVPCPDCAGDILSRHGHTWQAMAQALKEGWR